jgi:hypothetical protein
MSTQRYSVTPHPIENLLTWVESGEIAIPEIQRPFVWEPTKVRNLLDSLYHGYPIGYLIAWRNPTEVRGGESRHSQRCRLNRGPLPRITATSGNTTKTKVQLTGKLGEDLNHSRPHR